MFEKSYSTSQAKKVQMSESLIVGFLLSFSGGFMDAYTYVFRNGVFANAQTGNIILLGINLFEGSYKNSSKYLLPIFSFVFGVLLAQIIHLNFKNSKILHWRQTNLLIEIIIMTAVSFIGTDYNVIVTSLISLVCGIQVQSFQKIEDTTLATTMCTGNLKAATELLYTFIHTKKRDLLVKSLLYYGAIIVFMLGAVCGNFLVKAFGQKAILISVVLLVCSFLIMFINPKDENIETTN